MDGSPDQQIQIKDLDLSDILRNPHAVELHRTVLMLTTQVSNLVNRLEQAESKVELLQTENASLRTQQNRFPVHMRSTSSSISPNDSASQISGSPVQTPSPLSTVFTSVPPPAFIPPCPTRSSICPENYNAIALGWTLQDYKQNPANNVKASNRSRPVMIEAIRHPSTYEPLTKSQWDSLRTNAAAIMAKTLAHLKDPRGVPPGQKRTADWYNTHYPTQWAQALAQLEAQEPIVTYCAANWKAEAVFRVVLRRSVNAPGGSGSNEDDDDDDDDDDADSTAVDRNVGGGQQTGSGSKRRRSAHSPHRAKKPRSTAQGVPEPPKPKRPEPNIHVDIAKPLTAAPKPDSTAPAPPAVIDISFIQVGHSLESLEDELAEYPVLAQVGKHLVQAFTRGAAACTTDPSLSQPASEDANDLLTRLESTDPNSDMFDPTDDDNNNSGWGHYQFTACGKTITNVLTTWDSIGSVEFGQKLVAAAVRTSKVARFLCQTRKRPASSFVADAYLANLIEHIFSLIPVVYKTATPGVANATIDPSADREPDSPALLEEVQTLTANEMKKWLGEKSITITGFGSKKKGEMATSLLELEPASSRITFAEFTSLVEARAPKKTRSKKA